MSTATTPTKNEASSQYPVAQIPRINIEFFCDNSQTMQCFQIAAQDRRMAKAHVGIHLGGIAGAIQTYQNEGTPNLLVVESRGSRAVVMDEISQLAVVCQPNTKVLVVGHLNDVILYRDLIRLGISEYLVAPLHPVQVIESIAALYQDSSSAPLGRIVSFIGAKGGVGSSTLAHNIAWLISRSNIETVITDLDLSFGTAGLNFNQDGGGGIIDALSSPERVDSTLMDRLLTKLGDRLSLLNGPSSIDRDVSIEAHSVETILSVVRQTVPMVVVDIPNLWTGWVRHTLLNSDEVIITSTLELAALRNTKNIVDLLKASRPNDNPPKLILNQTGVAKRPEIPVADFASAIGLSPSLVLPYDAASFGIAQSNGKMINEVAAKSQSAVLLQDFTDLLVGVKQPAKAAKSGLRGFFDKLQSVKKKA